MLSVRKCQKILGPECGLSSKEVLRATVLLYELAQISLDWAYLHSKLEGHNSTDSQGRGLGNIASIFEHMSTSELKDMRDNR